MKKITATEQIFSPLGFRTAIKYHYEDGSSRVVPKIKKEDPLNNTLKNILKKFKKDI
jgi:hypothetical protein